MIITAIIAIWIGAAIADWNCHRRAKIETTGLAEPLLHVALIGMSGAGFLIAIFVPPSAAVITILAIILITHCVVSLVDIEIASSRREVTNFEHGLHYALNVCPLAVFVIYAITFPEPDVAYKAALFGAIAIFVCAPYAEEFIRCRRCRY
jgi:hypothetical protein